MTRAAVPVAIGARLGMTASTVHAVLTRCRPNRLSHVDVRTGQPVRRYEHERPGAMIRVDIKKLGNIPDVGGGGSPARLKATGTARPRPASPGVPDTPRRWHRVS